jgi:hypothetical protein
MTQAIVTRYIGPSNTRGSRIKATAWGGSITIPLPHDVEADVAHARAAQALCEKMGWKRGGWIGGGTPDEKGWCFVNINTHNRF